MPEEPSVKLATKASWPKLLNPLGRPLLLLVPMPAEFKFKRTDRAEVAGRHFQRVASAGDELQGAGPIGGPNATAAGQYRYRD